MLLEADPPADPPADADADPQAGGGAITSAARRGDEDHHHHQSGSTSINLTHNINTKPSTPSLQSNTTLDWPCPELESCNFQRRPSWQVEEQLLSSSYKSSNGGGNNSSHSLTPVLPQSPREFGGNKQQIHNNHYKIQRQTSFTLSGTSSPPPSNSTNNKVHNPFALSLYDLPPRSSTTTTATSSNLALAPAIAGIPIRNQHNSNLFSSHHPSSSSPPPFVSSSCTSNLTAQLGLVAAAEAEAAVSSTFTSSDAVRDSTSRTGENQKKSAPTFLSPFEAPFTSNPSTVEAPLSPFCLPGSPFSTDMESLASSPSVLSIGIASPGSSSIHSTGAGSTSAARNNNTTTICACGFIESPCSPSASSSSFIQSQQQQFRQGSSGEVHHQFLPLQDPVHSHNLLHHPPSSLATATHYQQQPHHPHHYHQHQRNHLHPHPHAYQYGLRPSIQHTISGSSNGSSSGGGGGNNVGTTATAAAAGMVPSDTAAPGAGSVHVDAAGLVQYRRRSVDVGTLGNARGHQRNGRTSQADAPAAAFVPPDQLKAHRAQRTYTQRSKESLFAQHLTSILSHSLSLCTLVESPVTSASHPSAAAPIPPLDLWANSDSPRSSISSIASNASTSDHQNHLHGHGHQYHGHGLGQSISRNGSLLPRRARLPSLPGIGPVKRKELIESASSWSFDANLLDLDELCELACVIFESAMEMEGLYHPSSSSSSSTTTSTSTSTSTGTSHSQQPDENAPSSTSTTSVITLSKIRAFLTSLRSAYHPQNAYHNFAHAVDVLQASYSTVSQIGVAPPLSRLLQENRSLPWKRDSALGEQGKIGDILRPLDVFALLVAAIGHDVGHPGLTNAYMINARTPAAQVYNDKSVLENFHSVTLIRMLKLHGFGSLLESDGGVGTEFRQVLLTSILVTDMSRHFPFVGKLTDLGARLHSNDYKSTNVAEDRLLICSGLMKCADISNPSRPHEIASFWSTALLEEWSVQAQIEAKFDLPISVVTLKAGERVAQAKSQVGFINLFTQPLFDAMASAVPPLQIFADHCRAGRRTWEAILIEEEDRESAVSKTASAAAAAAASSSSSPASPTSALSRALASPVSPRTFKIAPHRVLRHVRNHDSPYYASSSLDSGGPMSATSTSSFATSPSTVASFLKDDRASSISSATSSSSVNWHPSAALEEYQPLVEEECLGGCSDVTALCASCARKQRDADTDMTTVYGIVPGSVLVESGQWPPDPFKPSLQIKT